MLFRNVAQFFDDDELSAMRGAYERVCTDLHIAQNETDKPRRQRVATVIIELAQSGDVNFNALRRQAIIRLSETL